MLLLVLLAASLLLLLLSWHPCCCLRLAHSGDAAVFPAVICAPAVSVSAVDGFLTHFLASLRLLGVPCCCSLSAVAGLTILAGVPAVIVVLTGTHDVAGTAAGWHLFCC
jgi:hypothetical protein